MPDCFSCGRAAGSCICLDLEKKGVKRLIRKLKEQIKILEQTIEVIESGLEEGK